ncbi:MAG: hypothetical protein ACLGGX_10240, partial [Bdellovibrionia bacterium]
LSLFLSGSIQAQEENLELEFEDYTEESAELPPQEPPYISPEVPPANAESSELDQFLEAEKPPQEPPYVEAAPEIELAPSLNAQDESSNRSLEKTANESVLPRGKKRIAHPLAKKGLVAIAKDGSYIYRTETGIKSQSASLRLGQIQPPNIESADGTTNFEEMYGSGTANISFEYEWQPFNNWGKLGVLAGIGLFNSAGNGRYLSDGTPARETYTFWGVPISAGVSYRFEFSDRQWLAPYVLGGLSYYGLVETRDDGVPPKATGVPAAFSGGGALFSITHWDKASAHTIWSEYGIANMWVSLELRVIQSFSEDLDVSSNHVNLGLTFDY